MLKKLLFVCFSVLFSLIAKADIFNCTTVEEIHYALANVQAGDEIIIAPGTYISDASINAAYFYSSANGTASQPIIIRSESASDPAYLKGTSITSKTVLRIEGDYWIVKDLDISNGQKALVFDNSNYSKAINCVIHTTGNEAVHIRDGSDYVVIDGCTIYNTGNDNPGFGEGIYIGTDKGSWTTYNPYCDYTLVKNCTLGPDVRAEAFDIKEGTQETIIEYNTINGKGISGLHYADSFIDLKGARTYVRYNTFYQNNEPNILRGIAASDRGFEISGYQHAIHDNDFRMDNDTGNIVEAYSGTSEVHAWNNSRNPSGDMYNNGITQSCPSAWYNLCDSNQAPIVSITSPTDGMVFTEGDTIDINVDAYDNDGSISKVEFYSDSNFLGEDLSSPYRFSWDGITAGDYILTAVATDNNGLSTTSTGIEVSVRTKPVNSDLSLVYECGDCDPLNNKIKPHFKIVNSGNEAIPYSELKIRYWFSKEPSSSLVFTCDYASLGTSYVNGLFVNIEEDYFYMETSFDSAAGNLSALSDSGNIKVRANTTNWDNFDESNDYSFDGSINSYQTYSKIALYRNGELVWGTEPEISTVSMSSISSSGYTQSPKLDIKLYPNPTSNYINLISSKKWYGSEIKVFNMSGQPMDVRSEFSNNSYFIDLSRLKQGLYLINVIKDGQVLSKKVIVTR